MNNPSSGRPSILFVDDEEMTRKTFQRIASQEFPVLLASDVASAIEVLKENGDDIGVLLTDQRMPGGLGVELLEYAREHHPMIVRMLTTAYSELDDAIAAVNRGEIIRYISKPWDNIDALLIDLRVAMRFHQLEADNQALLEEKMSAKARGARVERIQALVALAANQANSNASLFALEQMLKSLSELHGMSTSGNGASQELYGGPVTEARLAQQLGSSLASSRPTRDGDTWADLARADLAGSGSGLDVAEHLKPAAGSIVARIESLLAEDSASGVTAQLDSSGDKLMLQYNGSAGNPALLRWVNGSVDTAAVPHLADLMALYFDVYALGGKINAGFSEAGSLNHLQVELPARQGEAPQYRQDDDWLEDVIILFA